MLFVNRPLVTKAPDSAPPCSVAARRKVFTHEFFDLIRTEPVDSSDLLKTHMVTQGHENDFAYCASVEHSLAFFRLGWRLGEVQSKSSALFKPRVLRVHHCEKLRQLCSTGAKREGGGSSWAMDSIHGLR